MRTYPALTSLLLLLTGCGISGEPLATVEHVDLQRYTGKWYEIARYEASFEKGCVASTAEYTARDDGKITVINRCTEESTGNERNVKGVARVIDPATNAKLKVSFFGPFEGDYWIIDLDEEYRWVVVGEPRRQYLWILSRTPQLDPALYQSILSRLPANGYDAERLLSTPQFVPASENTAPQP